MEIIKHGIHLFDRNSEYDKQTKRFECKSCGCIFDAEKTEYRYLLDATGIDKGKYGEKGAYREAVIRDKRIYICQCPECDNPARVIKNIA